MGIIKTVNFNYTGSVQTWVVPCTGKYKLESWGASGGVGYGNGNPFGLGGYACGEIQLIKDETMYIYVGEDGVSTYTTRSFGGGGASYATSGHNGGRGGGASDIRRGTDDLNHRIIVAGGGGGAQSTCGGTNTTAGHGGGLTGTTSYNNGPYYTGAYATGGTQTDGGTAHNNNGQPIITGTFGYGANSQTCGAGGGGGWWGGASTYTAGGGGGSSYIGTLQNASTKSGINTGNGKVIITLLYDEYAFLLEKGGKYYLPIEKYFDIHAKSFIPVSINDIEYEINNNTSNVSLFNLDNSFIINTETFKPLDIIDISQYKICVIPVGSIINQQLYNLSLSYMPTDVSLSKTTIRVKDKYTPFTDELEPTFLDITATDKSKIDYFLDYGQAKSYKSCSILNTEAINNDFYANFKLNSADSLLQSITLYGKDNNTYTKLKNSSMDIYEDKLKDIKFISFSNNYKEVIVNKLTKQSLDYTIDTLDKF